MSSKPNVTSTKQRICTDTSPSCNNKASDQCTKESSEGDCGRAHMKVKERAATIRRTLRCRELGDGFDLRPGKTWIPYLFRYCHLFRSGIIGATSRQGGRTYKLMHAAYQYFFYQLSSPWRLARVNIVDAGRPGLFRTCLTIGHILLRYGQ